MPYYSLRIEYVLTSEVSSVIRPFYKVLLKVWQGLKYFYSRISRFLESFVFRSIYVSLGHHLLLYCHD